MPTTEVISEVAAVDDVDGLIEQYHLALGEFMKGTRPVRSCSPIRRQPWLTPVGVSRADGSRLPRQSTGSWRRHVTPEFAYVRVERLEAKLGGSERSPLTPCGQR